MKKVANKTRYLEEGDFTNPSQTEIRSIDTLLQQSNAEQIGNEYMLGTQIEIR